MNNPLANKVRALERTVAQLLIEQAALRDVLAFERARTNDLIAQTRALIKEQ